MAKIIEKDILNLTKDDLEYGKAVIMQQVNCQNEMDAGVAMAIDKLARKLFNVSTVELYHRVYAQEFAHAKQLGKTRETADLPVLATVGAFVFSFSQWDCGSDGKHYTDDHLLVRNIKSICKDSAVGFDTLYKTVYIPYKIGCGLGGGNWDYIYNQIKDIPNLVILKRKDDQ